MSVQSFLVVLIVMLTKENFATAQVSSDFVSSVPAVHNYIAMSDILAEMYARGVTECAKKCSDHVTCRSFFYHKDHKFCQLEDDLYVDKYPLEYYYKTRYYRMEKVVSNFTCPPAPPTATYNQVLLSDNTVFTYRVVMSLADQVTAAASCSADGGWLVRILTVEKMQTLINIFTSCPGYANSGIYWTDGSNANAANFTDITQWTTSVNNPLPTTNEFWAQGEPAMPDLLHCSALGLLYGYQLASFDCLTTNYFICEK